MMHIRDFAVCLSAFFVLLQSALSAPSQPAVSNQLDTGTGLAINLLNPLNNSVLNTVNPASAPVNHSASLKVEDLKWEITDDLYLALTVCDWEPDPATIRAVLAAADTAVGKKPSAGLLDKKFTQRSNNRYNTLLFIAYTDHWNRRLTWGDVAQILGPNGLPKFYDLTQQWNSVYFDVIDVLRGGEIGHGALRRWWQLGLPDEVNDVAVGEKCSKAASSS